MDAPEATRRQTNTDKLAAFLKAHEGEWIDARRLEAEGGRQAWRTRISDCRCELGMNIENKQERVRQADGSFTVRSSYRYLPHTPLGPDASAYRVQKRLF